MSFPCEIASEPTYLMVRHHDHPFREVAEQTSIDQSKQLPPNTLISADPHNGRGPALGNGHGEEPERLFGESDPSIVPVFVDEVQRSPQDLGCNDSSQLLVQASLSEHR